MSTFGRPGHRPAVHQVLAMLRYGDAISHQATAIAAILRAAGYRSEIVVEHADARSRDRVVDYRDMVDEIEPDDLVILHFSVGSQASRAAFAVPSRMALNYHNITPPEFFVGVHDDLARLCYQGRRELLAFRSRTDLALGASEFNRRELQAMGFDPTAVLPVVPDFSHLSGPPEPWVRAAFDDDLVNVLFVGRITPNKRQDQVIRHFATYQRRFTPRSRLLLAGTAEGFEGYLTHLEALTARLGASNVHVLGHVTNEELTALYDVADLFLSASEHEGFCVPIVEAFHMGVPVMALARTAVPDTMDGGGVLYDSTDPEEVAGLMQALLEDEPRLEAVLAAQDAALARLAARDFAGELIGFVTRVLDSPRKPLPTVAPSWEGFRTAARLSAIRETRPLAYHRLPPRPAERGLFFRRRART